MPALEPLNRSAAGLPAARAQARAPVKPVDAAPAPAFVRRVTSAPLDTTLARAVRGRADRALLQRVGEQKLGIEMHMTGRSKHAIQVKQALKQALEEIRKNRRERKDRFETEHLATLGKRAEWERQRVVMNEYPKLLEADGDILRALGETKPFKGETVGAAPILKLDGVTVTDQKGNRVATLKLGAEAFVESPRKSASGNPRRCFKRLGSPDKQYVADDFGVPTRRFAYAEKNVHQLMELIATGGMTGRYQILHQALGLTVNLLAVTKTASEELTGETIASGDPVPELTFSQLAVLHQWKGSGMEQRGLSLTSTPRERAVFANRGGSFRSATGARIKIDLAQVPTDVVLINHYAAGGLKDAASDVDPLLLGRTDESKYSYVQSVVKNRELYLERLEPAWIADIELHDQKKSKAAEGKTGAELLEAIKADVGFAAYADGFRLGVGGSSLPHGALPMMSVGHAVGVEYAEGHAEGSRTRLHGRQWAHLKTAAHESDKHTIYWIGWAHGARRIAKRTTLDARIYTGA